MSEAMKDQHGNKVVECAGAAVVEMFGWRRRPAVRDLWAGLARTRWSSTPTPEAPKSVADEIIQKARCGVIESE